MRRFKITASNTSNAPKLSQKAQNIADLLGDFLGEVADLPNLEDYFDEYDNDALGQVMDALYDFAKSYATDVNGVE